MKFLICFPCFVICILCAIVHFSTPMYHLQYSPIWHASLLSNSITPHVKPNSHDSAGNKDDKNHEGANQKIQESIKERAAMKIGDWGEE